MPPKSRFGMSSEFTLVFTCFCQPNDLGVGVVGVAQVDFLQPIHNKQDFNKDEKYK